MTRPVHVSVLRPLSTLACGVVVAALLVASATAHQGRPASPSIPGPFLDGGAAGVPDASTAITAGNARRRKRPDPAFAGYLATSTGRTTIQARLEVPRYHCTSKEQAISPGVFLLSGPVDHEYFSAANIILGCYKGRRVSEEAVVVNNIERNALKPLHTGDTILVRITDAPGGSMKLRVMDLTPGHRFSVGITGRGAAAQAELLGDWASVDNTTGMAVSPPRFAPTRFSASRIDGKPLGAAKPAAYEMERSGKLQISTTRLSGTPRDTFTCRRR